MPFQTAALTAPQLVKLRGDATTNPTYRMAKYLSLCPNTTIFAAQVSSVPVGNSIQQLVYGSVTTGAYTAVIVDQRVLISHTTDRRAAFFDGRTQAAPSSTNLYLNETSAAVAIGDYIFVVDDYPLKDKLTRPVGTTQYKDYNVSFRRMLPYVKGLQTAYCGWIATPSDVSTKFRVAFSITALAADSGASISSYLWTFPASKTIISGSTTAAAVTVDFASSVGDWCHLKVTDSNGNYITRHFFVHAASDTYPPASGFSGLQISGGIDNGWSASCEAFSGVSSVLDRTFAVGWDQEYYNGTEGALLGGGAAVKFVGRFRQETISTQSHEVYSQIQGVRYSFEGPTEQLSSLESLPRALTPKASPTIWDEIKDLTLWRAIVHILSEHSTFLNLHDLSFDDTGTTVLTAQLGIQGGDIYRAVQDLAVSINAVFEFAPQGESRVIREAVYQTSAERNALPTVADFTSQDWISISIDTDPVTKIGKVPASGGTYNSTTAYETPLLSLAPGLAQESGTDEPALTRQILTANATPATAQSELNTRAGHHYAKNNNRITLNVLHPDGYNFLVPSVGQWYTWTIAVTDNVRGLAYTTATRWQLISVSAEDDNEHGTKGGGVNATYIVETSGAAGVTIQYPTESEITPYLPDIPFDPYAFAFPEDPYLYLGDSPLDVDVPPTLDPDSGATVPKDGNAVISWDTSAARAVLTRDFLRSANPPWVEVTPNAGGGSTWSAIIDFTTSNQGWVNTPIPPDVAYGSYVASTGWEQTCNTPDAGANYYTSVVISVTIPTTTISSVSVEYNKTNGTFLATNNDQIFYNEDRANILEQVDSSTVSGSCTLTWAGTQAGVTYLGIALACSHGGSCAGGSITVTRITVNGTGSNPFGGGSTTASHINHGCFDIFPGSGGKVAAYLLADDNTNSFVFRTEDVYANPVVWAQGTSIAGLYKTLRLTSAAGTIRIYNPSSGGNAIEAYSSDYGGTWATITVGTSPGATGGFDTQTQYGGTVALGAGSTGQARKATTVGGAYANAGAALANIMYIIIPWYKWSSDSTQNSGATPDYLIGLSALSGGGSLFRDTGGVRTDISPSVGGTVALFTSPNFATMWKSQRIAVVGNISGTPHVFTSTNAGTAFTDRGAVVGCTFILIRRRSVSAGQIYWNKTGGIIQYTRDLGVTIVSKTTPLSTVSGLDIWG